MQDQKLRATDHFLVDRWLLVPALCVLIFVFGFRYPAAMDMPNHLARAHILNSCLEQQRSALCDNFQVQFKPISYFFPDYTLMLLLRIVPSEFAAGNIAIFLMLLINLVGWYCLFREVNSRCNPAYVAGLALLMNNFLYKGFYAYLLGNGALLLWLAFWWPRRDMRSVRTSLALSFGLFLLFLCHLAAFFTAVFCFCLYAAHAVLTASTPKRREVLLGSLGACWPLLLTFCALYGLQQLETGATLLQQVGAQGWAPEQGMLQWLKLKLLRLAYVFVNHEKYLDLGFFALLCALTAFAAGLRWLGTVFKHYWGLAFLGLTAVYAVAPDISHGGSDVDLRFLLPAYFCLFLWLGGGKSSTAAGFKIISLVLLLWFCFNFYHRIGMERELALVDGAISRIPPGHSLVEVNSRVSYPSGSHSRVNPFSHFATYYYLRGGVLVDGLLNCYMNPNIPYFCYRDSALATRDFKNQFQGLAALTDQELETLHDRFEYFLVIEPEASLVRKRLASERFEELYNDGDAYLFHARS